MFLKVKLSSLLALMCLTGCGGGASRPVESPNINFVGVHLLDGSFVTADVSL